MFQQNIFIYILISILMGFPGGAVWVKNPKMPMQEFYKERWVRSLGGKIRCWCQNGRPFKYSYEIRGQTSLAGTTVHGSQREWNTIEHIQQYGTSRKKENKANVEQYQQLETLLWWLCFCLKYFKIKILEGETKNIQNIQATLEKVNNKRMKNWYGKMSKGHSWRTQRNLIVTSTEEMVDVIWSNHKSKK